MRCFHCTTTTKTTTRWCSCTRKEDVFSLWLSSLSPRCLLQCHGTTGLATIAKQERSTTTTTTTSTGFLWHPLVSHTHLIGYKGGNPNHQVNQDRALVVSPYHISKHCIENENETTTTTTRLLGVFDGHAKLGEGVSQYVVQHLPTILAEKLNQIYHSQNTNADEQEDTDSNGTRGNVCVSRSIRLRTN